MLIKRMVHLGYWFVSVDYSGLELCTLAQCLIDLFGRSAMAEAINDNKDLHLLLASQVLGMTYDEAKKKKKSPEVKNMRQLAKCFHPDVEVLTRSGWKKISLLSVDEEVAAADPKSPTDVRIVWTKPTRLTHRPSPGHLLHLENKGIDLRVTEDHRMVGYTQTGKVAESTPQDFGKFRGWFNAGMAFSGSKIVDDRLLRLAVATQADGSYQGRKVRFGFSKQRKIERLKSLLFNDEYTEAEYTNGSCPKNTKMFTLNVELSEQIRGLLDADKTFPWWWLDLHPELRNAVLDEAQHWDSSWGGKMLETSYGYSSTIRKNLDVLQAIAVITNRKSRLHPDAKKTAIRNATWKLSVRKKHDSRGGNVSVTKIPYTGDVYCLTVPTDCILVRDEGVVVVTKQCANFGYPGGMAAETFIGYAKSGYGVNISLSQAEDLKAAWMAAFPEMKDYFKYIKEQIGLSGEGTIVQLMSGRIRGCCGFCDGCNTLFQGRAADGAKEAHYRVAKACYIDKSSPLYGSRPVVFVHDEIITEVPIVCAHEAAYEQSRIMIETMQKWCPDVTIKAEPALMTRWRKSAETVFRCPEHGVTDEKCCDRRRLIPWEPCITCNGKGKVPDGGAEVDCPSCKGKCFESVHLPF